MPCCDYEGFALAPSLFTRAVTIATICPLSLPIPAQARADPFRAAALFRGSTTLSPALQGAEGPDDAHWSIREAASFALTPELPKISLHLW
jgi:hypothetical protein